MTSSLLRDLKGNGKLRLETPSAIIADEFAERAVKGIRIARRVKDAPEQAIPLAYFAAYHAIQSLFWRLGIRCETHAGSRAFLEELKEHALAQRLRELHEKRWRAHYGTDLLLLERDAEEAIACAQEIIDRLRACNTDDARAKTLFDAL